MVEIERIFAEMWQKRGLIRLNSIDCYKMLVGWFLTLVKSDKVGLVSLIEL